MAESEDERKRRLLRARAARVFDEAWQERRRQSREYILSLLESISSHGCSDTKTARLLKLSKASVSKWRSGLNAPCREALDMLEQLEEALRKAGPPKWKFAHVGDGKTPGGMSVRLKPMERNMRLIATADAIRELRRISGLPWTAIGELMGVGRHEIYDWRLCKRDMPARKVIVLRNLLRKYGRDRS